MNKAIGAAIALLAIILILPLGVWLAASSVETFNGVMAGKY